MKFDSRSHTRQAVRAYPSLRDAVRIILKMLPCDSVFLLFFIEARQGAEATFQCHFGARTRGGGDVTFLVLDEVVGRGEKRGMFWELRGAKRMRKTRNVSPIDAPSTKCVTIYSHSDRSLKKKEIRKKKLLRFATKGNRVCRCIDLGRETSPVPGILYNIFRSSTPFP